MNRKELLKRAIRELIAESKLNESGILKWGKRKQISYKQNAYDDVVTYEVPYEGELKTQQDFENLRKAIHKMGNPHGISPGRGYGTTTYTLGKHDPTKKTVTVTVSFYIGEGKVEEASTTAAVAGYDTPNAFAGSRPMDKKKRLKNMKQAGWEPVNEELSLEGESLVNLREIAFPSYRQLKKNEDLEPREKIGFAIREVRQQMRMIESFVDSSLKLKQENNVQPIDYWKRTHLHLNRLGEQMNRIMAKFRELGG